MKRLMLAAAALIVASPALAQQSRLLQPTQPSRLQVQPGAGLAGRQPQIQVAPRPGAPLISDRGGALISNNRGGLISNDGGSFRR